MIRVSSELDCALASDARLLNSPNALFLLEVSVLDHGHEFRNSDNIGVGAGG